jgi:hypothetical protein
MTLNVPLRPSITDAINLSQGTPTPNELTADASYATQSSPAHF